MDLPPTIFPISQSIKFGLIFGNHHGSGAVYLLSEYPVHTGHQDPVHTGLTYPVGTDHLEHFGHFMFCTISIPH